MKNLASYLLVMFMVMFWIFRVVIAFTTTMGIDIGIEAMNLNFEIILLFVTLICVLLVIKRKILGAIIYLISYGAYFGVFIFNQIKPIIDGSGGISDYGNVFLS